MHTTKTAFIKIFLSVFLVMALAACSAAVSKNSGPKPLRPKILIGSSTKADVEALFGTPTDVLPRDGEVWVYRNLTAEDVQGIMPFFCGDKPLVFQFDLDGTVSLISRRVPAL